MHALPRARARLRLLSRPSAVCRVGVRDCGCSIISARTRIHRQRVHPNATSESFLSLHCGALDGGRGTCRAELRSGDCAGRPSGGTTFSCEPRQAAAHSATGIAESSFAGRSKSYDSHDAGAARRRRRRAALPRMEGNGRWPCDETHPCAIDSRCTKS